MNKNFLLLWTGKLVSELGDKFYAIAIAWWILEESGSSVYMGLYLALSVLPGILVGIYSGAYIDRLNVKILIIIMDAVRGIVILFIAWLYLFESLQMWHVLLSTVIISIASSFFNPAILVMIPRIVNKELLTKANSFMQLVDGIATVVGPVIGAGFVMMMGYSWVIALNGVSFLLSALFEGFIKLSPKDQSVESKCQAIHQDVKDGFNYLKQHKSMMIIMLIIGVAHLFIGAIIVAMPIIAKSLSGNGIRSLGYMETSLGLGFIIGAIITGRRKATSMKISRLFNYLITVGVCFICIGIISLQSIGIIIIFCVILIFVIGFAIVNASIYWQTFIQYNTPENMLGRMSAISSLIGDITLPISFALFGFLLDIIRFEYLMIICGFTLVINLIIILKFIRIKYVANSL